MSANDMVLRRATTPENDKLSDPAAEGEAPNAVDMNCRRVRDKLPATTYLISAVAICNQWAYFAFTGPLREPPLLCD